MDEITSQDKSEAGYWLGLIEKADRKLKTWQDTADNIDKLYSELERFKGYTRDREFAMFWANIQIMGPSIYARPPVPVVTPKFKDRRPLYRTSSEFLERCCNVGFDMANIDDVMIELRDDLNIVGRGVAWVRYETTDDSDTDTERCCVEHIDRKDFSHDPARKWSEVDWVAVRAWLDKDGMRERFGDEWAEEASYKSKRDSGGRFIGGPEECGVWEIWCKSENKVIWVTDGCSKVLDESEPHLKLSGFFPCPRPVYATKQRRTLIPVPDFLYYRDQLEEINDLTRRIHALSWAIKVRGFYGGNGDLGEAIERAVRMADDDVLLIPVPALTALMQGGGDPIMWMPLEMIAGTISGLVELRRQIIDDVYQIMGLSDIQRGSTEAAETLGAQRLKQQNGSVRVRDKQNELIRIARDVVRIMAEIMAEEFDKDTLIDMAQMDIPTRADVKREAEALKDRGEAQIRGMIDKAMQDPKIQQAAQQNPQAAQAQVEQMTAQVEDQVNQQLAKLEDKPTQEDVMEFLRDNKLRPFVLDIETDSTIYADEAAEKSSRQEFMQAFAGTMQALIPMMAMGPEAVAVAGGVFKFALAPYRVGRELEGLIDDFTDQGPEIAKRMAAQNGGDGEDMAQANMALAQAEMKKAEAAVAKVQADTQGKQQDMQLRMAEAQAKASEAQQKFALEVEQTKGTIAETQARIEKIFAEIQKLGIDAQNQTRQADREDVKTVASLEQQQQDSARADAKTQIAATESQRAGELAVKGDQRADRQQEFTETQAERDARLKEGA